MTHELGHLLGLDHSVPGTNPCGTTSDDLAALPIMYYLLQPAATGLTADDKAWISLLYPAPSFNSTYGTITGQVLFSDGQNAVQDVLVTAHPASPGTAAGENRAIAISSISGYRFTGNPGQPYTADHLPCTNPADCPHGYYGNNVDDACVNHGYTAPGMSHLDLKLPPGGSQQFYIHVFDYYGRARPDFVYALSVNQP